MTPSPRSTILGLWLRALRNAAGMSGDRVATELLQCSTSRVYSIEGGYRPINKLELAGLLTAFGKAELLPQLERLRSGAESTDAVHSIEHDIAIVAELEGMAMQSYGLVLDQVPKLMQTRGYMELQCTMAGYGTEETELYVKAMLERQYRYFALPTPPPTSIIVSESALDIARQVQVDGQFELIDERARHPSLNIKVLYNSTGPHFAASSFTIMQFGELPALLYNDLITGSMLISDVELVCAATDKWNRLAEYATDYH